MRLNRRSFILNTAAATATGAAASVFAQPSPLPTAAPLRVSISEERLSAIMERVRDFPWFDPPTGPDGKALGWRYGVDIAFLRRLSERWLHGYDWRSTERQLNQLPNFLADIGARKLHFVHERGSGPQPRPLLLIHGWAYSAYSFRHVLDQLAHPERYGGDARDAFSVVAVSAPGYLFSARPRAPESLRSFGRLYHQLMFKVLGYERYLIDGADQGALSGSWIALENPKAIAGVRLSANVIFPRHAEAPFGSGKVGAKPSAAEVAYVKEEADTFQRKSAYFPTHLMLPETLSAAMVDSPVGQAAWLVDRHYHWTDLRHRTLEQAFGGMDRLIDEIMFYLVTDSFRTSIWPYAAFQDDVPALQPAQKIFVPFGITAWPDPLAPAPPRSFVERSRPNIVHWTTMPRGGHLPFIEEPKLWLDDLRMFNRRIP